jgi:hypothetical protein
LSQGKGNINRERRNLTPDILRCSSQKCVPSCYAHSDMF